MAIITILSFDPGTANLGYSLLRGDTDASTIQITDTLGVLNTSKYENGVELHIRERIDHLGLNITHLVEKVKPSCISMEDFVEQGRFVGKTYRDMAYLTEHLRMLTRDLGTPATIYPNGYWKKQTLGIMRASKKQVQHYISHKLPEAATLLAKQPDHVWDSVGIGYCMWLELLKNKQNLGGTEHEQEKKAATKRRISK